MTRREQETRATSAVLCTVIHLRLVYYPLMVGGTGTVMQIADYVEGPGPEIRKVDPVPDPDPKL